MFFWLIAMRKFYVPEPYPNLRQIPLLAEPRSDDNRLFQHLPFSEYKNIFEIVSDIYESDAVLLPHYLTDLAMRVPYLEVVEQIAHKAGKKLIIFTTQDSPLPITRVNSIIIRPSAYASSLRLNEIVAPALVEDLGTMYGVVPLTKGKMPTIGFVGRADFDSLKARIKYFVRNYALYTDSHRDGMYFRRVAIRAIEKDTRLSSHIISRRRFGAHRTTLELSLESSRTEYVESIKNSLFVLAPRGDGNYSLRFYEALSLGRIPILIDTDIILPFEPELLYDDCVMRIPYSKVGQINEIVWTYWSQKSELELLQSQQRAREIFESYLYYPRFLRVLFDSQKFTDLLKI